VLAFRIGLPLYRTLRHRLVVTAVVPEVPGVVSVHLTGRHLDELPIRAGQFLSLRFLARPGASHAHPYSISVAPSPYALRVTVKDLGDGSGGVARIHPGTRVLVEGPYGRLTAERRSTRKVLLIGAGIGITPLRSLAEELPQAPGDVVVLHRVRSPDEAVFREEFADLARVLGLRAVLVPGSRSGPSWAPTSSGPDGTAALLALVPDVAEREVYVCGPDAWMSAALDAARGAGVPDARLHAERFTW